MSRIASTFRRILREEGGWSRVWTSLAIALCLGAGITAYNQHSEARITCDQSSTSSSDFATDLSAISNGQTLCLTNAVNYGTFTGTSKTITIIAQAESGPPDPVDASMDLDFGPGDSGFTIDGNRARWDSTVGLSITGAVIVSGATNITIKNFASNSCPGATNAACRGWDLDPAPGPNANITIDHGRFYNDWHGEATIFIEEAANNWDTGIVIENNLFYHSSTDAIKMSGVGEYHIINNKILDLHESYGIDGNHTDGIQSNEGDGSTVRGNWIQDADQCLDGFDGQYSLQYIHNVVIDCDAHAITLMGDNPPSTIAWNTVGPGGADSIICGNKAGLSPASTTNIYNNVVPGGVEVSGAGTTCVPTRNDHNVSTAVTYVGGADPTTFTKFSDFCLAPASAGYTGADDSGQVGVCGGDYDSATDGPPTGEGY